MEAHTKKERKKESLPGKAANDTCTTKLWFKPKKVNDQLSFRLTTGEFLKYNMG